MVKDTDIRMMEMFYMIQISACWKGCFWAHLIFISAVYPSALTEKHESRLVYVFYCAGLAQPDEDDYGYVSQEASAFYEKLMEKYTSTPSEEPKFSKKSLLKSSAADLTNTKVS